MPNELELLPAFVTGEALTIQRNVNGQNVLMAVVVRDPSSLGASGMRLSATIRTWGVSPYADGRVDRQKRIIDRLMRDRAAVIELAIKFGVPEIVERLSTPAEAEDA